MKSFAAFALLALVLSGCGNSPQTAEPTFTARTISGYDENGVYRTLEVRDYDGVLCVRSPSQWELACIMARYELAGSCTTESLCSSRI